MLKNLPRTLKLAQIAYAYEKKRGSRRPPKMPVPDEAMEHVSIPELNSLFQSIGEAAYERILSINGAERRAMMLGEDYQPFTRIVDEKLTILKQQRTTD